MIDEGLPPTGTNAGAGSVQRFPCDGCGADFEWDPSRGALRCPYCGTSARVASPTSAVLVEHPLERAMLRPESLAAALGDGAQEIACGGCGATVTFLPPQSAGECAFCGARLVAQPTDSDPLLAPDGVLPFSVHRDRARASVRGWIQSRWFAPNALKKMARESGIRGVYLPFWTYDARTTTQYVGERGEHYWVEETYTTTDSEGRTVQRTRSVRRTRWYPAAGVVHRDFDDVLVPAATSLDQERLDALSPWDLAEAVPYRPEYLSGFQAQRYQLDPLPGCDEAKRRMGVVIDGMVRRDIGGDEQRVHHIDTGFADVTFKHLLLPVWLAAYRYRDRVYQVMVNARTGEVTGDRPWSVWKIAVAVLLGVAVAILSWWLINRRD